MGGVAISESYLVCDCLPNGLPAMVEHYGPTWEVRRADDARGLSPVVLVPDPGDGSARHLAETIAALLGSCTLPDPCT